MKGNELRFIYFSDFLAFTRRPLALKHEANGFYNGFYKELWTQKRGTHQNESFLEQHLLSNKPKTAELPKIANNPSHLAKITKRSSSVCI